MNPRNVLLMSYCLDLGGSERQLTEVARTLDPARYRVFVACLRKEGLRVSELAAAGIPVTEFRILSFQSFSALRGLFSLAGYMRRNRIHIAHAFDAPMNVFGVVAARLARCPIVLSSQRGDRHLTKGPLGRLLPFSDRLVDGIVVNCEFMRHHLTDEYAVPNQKIYLCFNGIDTSAFHPPLFRDANTKLVGSICALRPEKNLPLLLEAFAAIAPRHTSARLVIVGSGEMLPALTGLAASLAIEGRCSFIPSTAEVTPWLHRIGIFVLPSRTEAFSNSLMEAMACGCATVASNVGGNPELIGLEGSEQRGCLFRSNDVTDLTRVLDELLSNPNRCGLLASRGRQFVESNLSIANSTRRMSEIYEIFASAKLP